MIVVKPITIGPGQVISTTAEDEYPAWSAGTYSEGQRVTHSQQVWESLGDGVTSEPSEDVPLDWLLLGYSNPVRMLFDGRDSPTTAIGALDVELLIPSVFTTFAALGLDGQAASLKILDPGAGVVYERTEQLVDIGATSFWEWFFLPYDRVDTVVFDQIPPYSGATVEFRIDGEPSETVAVGRVLAGTEVDIGCATYGTSAEILDFSQKERDGFGKLKIVKRRVITLIDYDVYYQSSRFDSILRLLRDIASEPTLFIGEKTMYRGTITFGVFRTAIPTISGPSVSEMTLQVEEF